MTIPYLSCHLQEFFHQPDSVHYSLSDRRAHNHHIISVEWNESDRNFFPLVGQIYHSGWLKCAELAGAPEIF